MPNFFTIIILYPFIGEVFLFSDLHYDVSSHILDIHTVHLYFNNNLRDY